MPIKEIWFTDAWEASQIEEFLISVASLRVVQYALLLLKIADNGSVCPQIHAGRPHGVPQGQGNNAKDKSATVCEHRRSKEVV